MQIRQTKKKHEAFYEELGQLLIKHGIKELKFMSCRIGETGNLMYNKEHVTVSEDDRTFLQYGSAADKVIKDSLIDHALKHGNKELFERALAGQLYDSGNKN